MEFVELGQIDSVAGPVAGAFHSPKMSEGADRRVHAGLDLDQDEVRLQLVERWRSRHAVEDVGYGSRPRSAMVRLDRLRLVKGQKIAYVLDFGDEWRVLLTLSAIRADDGAFYPQILAVVGDAPPQYPEYDDEADAA